MAKSEPFDFEIRSSASGGYEVIPSFVGARKEHRFVCAFPPEPNLSETSDAGIRMRFDAGAGLPDWLKAGGTSLDQVKSIGGALYTTLFRPELPGIFAALRERAERDGDSIRIGIQLDEAGDLARLPWETLYDAADDRFLGVDPQSNIVRLLSPSHMGARPAKLRSPVKVLIAIANPQGDLAVQEEVKRIGDRLSTVLGESAGQYTLSTLGEATKPALADRMQDFRPDIVHFVGHGGFAAGKGAIQLHDEDAPKTGRSLSSDELRHLMLIDKPKLVVLNSCQGGTASPTDRYAGVAQNLIRLDIPYVVAMQFPVSDTGAVRFAERFYASLATGETVECAVTRARHAIFVTKRPAEFATPVLYSAGHVTDLRVELPADAEPAATPAAIVRRRAKWPVVAAIVTVVVTVVLGSSFWLAITNMGAQIDYAVAPSEAGSELSVGPAMDEAEPSAAPSRPRAGSRRPTRARPPMAAPAEAAGELPTAPPPPPVPQPSAVGLTSIHIGFASGSAMLDGEAVAALETVVASLDRGAGAAMTILPMASTAATAVERTELAYAREKAVRDYLAAHGVAAEAVAVGESRPPSDLLLEGLVLEINPMSVPAPPADIGLVAPPTPVLFEIGSAAPIGAADIERWGRTFANGSFAGVQVQLIGHADRLGSKAFNERLANARARAVAALLTRSGVPASAIIPVGAGTRWAPPGRSVDPFERRVDVRILLADAKRILFGRDGATMTPFGSETVAKLAQWLRQYPGASLLIEGHADRTGPESYNLALGERRAEAARDALVARGIDPARLTLRSFGETRPALTDTPAGLVRDRRAEFLLLPAGRTDAVAGTTTDAP